MARELVGAMVLPAAPEDATPGAGEDADGMRMAAATRASTLVDQGRPAGAVSGVVGKGGEGTAQAFVARPAEDDGAVLAGGVGDGRQAGLGGELGIGGEAGAIIAELGEDLGRVVGAAARQALYEGAVRMLAQGGEGLGAVWGEQKTREYLGKAGFRSVEKNTLAHDIQTYWYVVRK